MTEHNFGGNERVNTTERVSVNRHTLPLLHLLLALYSCAGVLSKLAAGEAFLSPMFLLCYGCMIAILGLYAIGWQQVIKRMPLTTAYANRAVTVVWGVVWGLLVFHETFSALQMAGCALVVAGVVLFAMADGEAR